MLLNQRLDLILAKKTVIPANPQIGALDTVLNIDMANWWRPTKEAYLNTAARANIAAALSEVLNQRDFDDLNALPDQRFRDAAEEVLIKAGWMPAYFR